MSANKHQFAVDASKIAFDQRHSQTIKFNISKYDAAVTKGFGRYRDLALARQEAARILSEIFDREITVDIRSNLETIVQSKGSEING